MEPIASSSIRLSADRAINYAFQQNAIPVIKELVLQNDGVARKQLTLRLTTEPAFASPHEIRLAALEAHGEFRTHLRGNDLKLSHDFLFGLNERIEGWLKVEALEGETVIHSHTQPIALLARNEWCGLASLPEILAAFVLPNDPAVTTLLSRASELLREQTGRSDLNGYQDKNRRRAWEQVAAIYKAVTEQRLRYLNPPPSFEETGQKILFPSQILSERFGACLDLSLLFAACCERAGLHPLVLIHEGHAYAGCWLEERTFPNAVDDGPHALQQVRKYHADSLLTVFETTLVSSDTPTLLTDAEKTAQAHLQTEKPFRLILDVRQARSSQIKPIPLLTAKLAEAAPVNDAPPSTQPPPGLGTRTFEEPLAPHTSSTSKQPASRIDLWKSRLLDLSLRNRLLNFRETKTTVRLLTATPEHVEDELAAERELSLHPRPPVMSGTDPRHRDTLSQSQREEALAAFLSDELKQRRLHTHLEEKEHHRRLTELFREARKSLEENGTNTLYAAVGLLEWRETEHSDRVHRAPLLLVPVELKRKSVLEGFSLRRLDEETRLNVTLLEMLRRYFQKEVPGLDPLPEDDKGVDVAKVFRIFREAVRELPGWEVKTEVWLGLFFFTKFLLWKDLSDRLDVLTHNRIVDHLVHAAGLPYDNPPDDITPEHLDDRFHPRDVFCPRSADSSQLAAVMAAATGHDFVLEGPPGTGKSQTITNIIAHCLAHGKRVLFVAEKRAALEVVHRRLREEGLEPFCLELHSNKTGKTDVLAQFERSLKFVAQPEVPDWEQRAAELERLRAALNNYARTLHRRWPCGLSAHACFDYLLPRRHQPPVRLDWSSPLDTPAEKLASARQLASLLQLRAKEVGPLRNHPLTPIACEEWSPAWEERTFAHLRDLQQRTAQAADATQDLLTWLGRPGAPTTQAQLTSLLRLVECLLTPHAVGPAFATISWDQLAQELDHWTALLHERATLRQQLADYNEAKLLALNLDDLHATWASAQSSWFLVKWLRTRSVQNTLRSAHHTASPPLASRLDAILTHALRLRELNRQLSDASATALQILGLLWGKSEPSTETLAAVRTWGESLHRALLACAGEDLAWLASLRQLLSGLFTEGPAFYAPGTAIGARLTRYRDALATFQLALQDFTAEVQLRSEPLTSAADYLPALHTLTEQLTSAWRQTHRWCAWQKARRAALEAGLAPLVTAMETAEGDPPDVPGLFERSFRQALLYGIIEHEPTLREFFGHEHNERIEQFRQLDDKLTQLSRELIQARLASRIPRDQGLNDVPKTEIGLLLRELKKKTRHIPVRKLLASLPHLFPRLKPCVLMSPLSVAQYLEPSHDNFDVVIFDEASQIPVWDAIGAIARGKQLIVVGDPKQLPPTSFFTSNNTSDEGDEDTDSSFVLQEDLESILDELLSHQLRQKRLQWHYRSRHESLIAFSNRQYYDNSLLTFPSSETNNGGVRFHYLPHARYDRGASATNRKEARALVAELVSRLRAPHGAHRSYGIVTFSLKQQKLIENLLDEERRKYPEIEVHFGDEPPVEGEPVFVKNLENVQGDERDVIFFSICYGPDETGHVSMNFGPLNRKGGERRLNVAITRAKHEIVVFSGLRADQIDLTRTQARGVCDLQLFLNYAERGPAALTAASLASRDAATESEFEKMVAARLRDAGYQLHHQVGCSGYRIDLAVVDPRTPGRYLLGIECDGATYHRAATARDRDKLRQIVLEGLGWKLHRIWSTDWWHDADKEMQRLLAALKAAEAASAARQAT